MKRNIFLVVAECHDIKQIRYLNHKGTLSSKLMDGKRFETEDEAKKAIIAFKSQNTSLSIDLFVDEFEEVTDKY